jgi:hypothetical protein
MRFLFFVLVATFLYSDDKIDRLEMLILQNQKDIKENSKKILGQNLEPLFSYDNKTLRDMLLETTKKNNYLEKETNNLKVEVLLLKNDIEKLKEIIDKKSITMYANREDVSIKKKPLPNAKVVRKIYKDEAIKVEYCKNGWCKMIDEEGYIAEYILRSKK